ncbi:MAG: hypothetical protein AAF530_14810 [Pseudomonadota bacterium]
MELLTWQIVWRSEKTALAMALPQQILTVAPAFTHQNLPPEVGLLLPSLPGARQLVNYISDRPLDLTQSIIGLFLADPFFAVAREKGVLDRANASWVTNLPSVAQQDPGFFHQLADVGLDQELELERLAALKDLGVRIAITVVDGPSTAKALALEPAALFVVPRVSDFAAGFPSLRQRGAAAQQVAEAAKGAGWEGPIVGLSGPSEAAYERQWPTVLSGVLCRPRPKPG